VILLPVYRVSSDHILGTTISVKHMRCCVSVHMFCLALQVSKLPPSAPETSPPVAPLIRRTPVTHELFVLRALLLLLLLRLCVVHMLLSKLSTKRGDFILQCCNHVRVLLLRTLHASFHLSYVLPNIDLAAHDFTNAAAAAALT